MPMRQAPNILLLHCDSLDGRVMGCAGHAAAHTPNLDALAARGLRFRNAYCPSPLCVPSRVATWLGQHSHRSHTWGNPYGVASDEGSFMQKLQTAGYDAASIGRDDRFAGGHSMANRLTAWTRSSGVFLARGDVSPRATLATDLDVRVREIDWKHTDEACARLARFRSGDPPWILSLGWIAPHPMGGYRTSPTWLDRIDADKISLPPADRSEHPAMAYMRRAKGVPDNLPDEEVLAIRRHYCAMVAEVDAQIGLVLAQLERSGLADSTVVIFFSDHGDLQMEHRQWRKSAFFEGSARVPLILAGPGLPSGVVCDELASLLDLHPTLIELAGLPHDEQSDGISLLGEDLPEDRPIVAQYHDSMQPTGSFMLREGLWKLIEFVGMDPLLFHLGEDPDEIDDRSRRDAAVCERLRKRLRQLVDPDAIDQEAKVHDRRCLRTWRDLIGEAAYRDTMRQFFPTIGDEDFRELDRWLAEPLPPVASFGNNQTNTKIN